MVPSDPSRLEPFLNSLKVETSIIPIIVIGVLWAQRVDFVPFVEKVL